MGRAFSPQTLGCSGDLKTTACSMSARPPPLIAAALRAVPAAVRERFYGCGNPIPSGEGRAPDHITTTLNQLSTTRNRGVCDGHNSIKIINSSRTEQHNENTLPALNIFLTINPNRNPNRNRNPNPIPITNPTTTVTFIKHSNGRTKRIAEIYFSASPLPRYCRSLRGRRVVSAGWVKHSDTG